MLKGNDTTLGNKNIKLQIPTNYLQTCIANAADSVFSYTSVYFDACKKTEKSY